MAKILFSNSFNQTEYLRTLAKLGQNTFALRILNEAELCSYILEHGSSLPEGDFISSKEADYIFYHLTKGDFIDAKNLRSAIDSYRDCVIGDIVESLENNLTDDFPKKKELIKTQYQAYEEYKKVHHLYDKHDLLNYILSSDIHIDEECQYFEEFGISKILLEAISHVFAKVTKLHLKDVFTKKEKDIHFVKAYGKPCESDYVFSEIQKLPIDECQIVVLNNADSLEIIKTAEMLNIPYTSMLGTPIISTKAGVLLSYLQNLEKNSFAVDGYKSLFKCPFFNSEIFRNMVPETVRHPDRKFNDFVKYAGWLRLNYNSQLSDIHQDLYEQYHYEMLKKLQESLSKGRGGFIEDFIVNPSVEDQQVIEQIKRIELEASIYQVDVKDILTELLNSSINKKVSQSGHLYITNINAALSSLRKYNFIIGLTSDFPGGPQENYLIFDEEYLKTGSGLYLSQEIIKRKERVLRSLINASPEIYLSYPYFEIGALEDKNPSSVIFDIYPDDVEKMPSYGYQDLQLDMNKEVYQARLSNKRKSVPSNSISLRYDKDKLLNKEYSPSLFHQFFEKEYYDAFLLSSILEINIDEPDDPYVVIPPNELGTLIHEVMEKFQKGKTTLSDLLVKAEKAFDNFLAKKPPLIPSSMEKAKENYLRLVTNLYDMDPNNYHIFSEKYYRGKVGDILFGGTIDRVERDKFGNYIIVDYKTGTNVKHKIEDPVTCLQGLIYAYLLENYGDQFGLKNTTVHHIEFRYPENKDVVTITYNAHNKQALLDMMDEFKNIVESGQLFTHLDVDQEYLDKYAHLFSLMKGVKSL